MAFQHDQFAFTRTMSTVSFSGRASRAEYWKFVGWWLLISLLFVLTVSGIGYLRGMGTTVPSLLWLAFLLVTFIPFVALSVRRMHDTGHPSWFVFIPLANWVFLLSRGDAGSNRYGNPSDFGA